MKTAVLSLVVLALAAAAAAMPTTDADPIIGTPSGSESRFPIVYQFPLVNAYSVGIGFDGDYIWISAGEYETGECMFYLYDEYGTLLDEAPQGQGATGWGHRDMTTNKWPAGREGEPYVNASYSDWIHLFGDPFNYEGRIYGGLGLNRAIYWYWEVNTPWYGVSGFGEHIWGAYWDQVFGSTPTWQQLTADPIDGCYGMAYDEWQECIWVSTANSTGDIHQYSKDGMHLNTYTSLPEYDIHGGCTMVQTSRGYVLAVLMQFDPDMVVFYDVGSSSSVQELERNWGAIKAMFKQ